VADMVSSQMHVAALDRSLFKQVKPLIDDTIALGEAIFKVLKSAAEGSASEAGLRGCNSRALELIKRDQNELADVLREYVLSQGKAGALSLAGRDSQPHPKIESPVELGTSRAGRRVCGPYPPAHSPPGGA
jgi:hypothetical protein